VGEQLQSALSGGSGGEIAQTLELCWSGCALSDRPIVHNACQALRAARRRLDVPERKLEEWTYNTSCAPMVTWDQERVIGWLESRVSRETVDTLLEKGIDGASLAELTKNELNGFGILLNESTRLLNDISSSTLNIYAGFLPVLDPCSHLFGSPDWQIFVNVFVEKILEIDEQLYEFSTKMWIFQAYTDDRIAYLAPQADCKYAVQSLTGWQPSPSCADPMLYGLGAGAVMPTFFNNQKSVELLQENIWVFGAPINAVLQARYITATFNTEMSFVDFPFDSQVLTMTLRTTWDTNKLKMGIDTVNIGNNKAPGWAVQSIGSTAGFLFGNETFITQDDFHPFNFMMQGSYRYSAATMAISVKRESSFYLLNMIMPIWLLTMLSWTAFLMDPSSIDVRMSMVLTIMLGFIAFQFVVNDNMPKTGEESKLHRFMNTANLYIALVGLESILVYKIDKHDLGSFLLLRTWCPTWLLKCLGLDVEEEEKSGGASTGARKGDIELKDRPPTLESSARGTENAAATAAAREARARSSVVAYDGVTSDEEKAIISVVDHVALVLFPVSFGVIVWDIFQDKTHLALMCLILALVLIYLVAVYLLMWIEQRSEQQGNWRGSPSPRHSTTAETFGGRRSSGDSADVI
jgi:hypothetical protein